MPLVPKMTLTFDYLIKGYDLVYYFRQNKITVEFNDTHSKLMVLLFLGILYFHTILNQGSKEVVNS